MDAVFDQIDAALGGFLANPLVQLLVSVIAGYVIVLWLACALWAFVDMRRRTLNPFAPYAIAAAVIVASPLLFPLALLVHRVIRPAGTVSERRMSRLRDAALEVEVDRPTCPSCRRPVGDDWLICPQCRTTLGHRCERCGRGVATDWDACPWCGATFGPPPGIVRHDRAAVGADRTTPPPIVDRTGASGVVPES